MITEPKKYIYNTLKAIDSLIIDGKEYPVLVTQATPDEVIDSENPLLIQFAIESNVPNYDLSKDNVKQDIVVKIDLYAQSSIETGLLLARVEQVMLDAGYLLVYNSDIPEPSGLHHITTQFKF